MIYQNSGKRLIDLVLVILAILLLWPVLALIALLIYLDLGGPILFCQLRPGLNGQPFALYKFRTMKAARDSQGNLLPDGQRLTAFGRFLRSTSLDELPELFNILKGDMSLVGPRPLLIEYLEQYTPQQQRRHEVKPGLTGWAQVNGRNAITWERRFRLDVWYVDNVSLRLDLQIILLTIEKILTRAGISQPGHDTIEKFQGYSVDRL
ncbi:MAG: sugar transferase [Anaerolineae bacterium]|nr:sugar transferase [Anaerolineae bacterium]